MDLGYPCAAEGASEPIVGLTPLGERPLERSPAA